MVGSCSERERAYSAPKSRCCDAKRLPPLRPNAHVPNFRQSACAADAAAMRKMVSLINGLCYRPHEPVSAARPPQDQASVNSAEPRVFEPPSPQPRLTETQTPAGPRFMGTREKSGLVFQGEVRHECTKQALARLRPGGFGDSGRRDRRSRVARAEHLNLRRKAAGAGVASARGAASPHCPCIVITAWSVRV